MALESERQVLGSLINDTSLANTVLLDPTVFESIDHQKIYSIIKKIAGDDFDIIILADQLQSEFPGEWLSKVGSLSKENFSTATFNDHVEIIVKSANQRFAIENAKKILASNGDPEVTAEAVNNLTTNYFDAGNDNTGLLCDSINAAYADLQKQNEADLPGITTGLRRLDAVIGGWHETDYIILAGRTSMGKTALMLHYINHCNVPCLVISAEQTTKSLIKRSMCSLGSVSSSRMRSGNLTEEDWGGVTKSIPILNEKKIYINDTPGIHIDQVANLARKYKYKHDIQMLFVDYIQLLASSERSIREKTIDISKKLKGINKILAIPVLALSQISRDVEKRSGNRPMLSDLSESSDLEANADIVQFIHRDGYYDSAKSPKETNIIFAKNREGPTGVVDIHYEPEYLSFRDTWG